ncbi:MAG TPA: 3'-5' exonuclease [Longimicrobiaceae bacterium]
MIFFDLEGTGLDTANDRIVEFAFVAPLHLAEPWTERVNPGVPIPPEVSEIHGITDADVADLPGFNHYAPRIQRLIDLVQPLVLCGYNIRRYDTLLLDAELRRAGEPGLPRKEDGSLDVLEIDLYQIWCRYEGRNLAGAAKRFADRDLEGAHAADADTDVLADILEGMCRAFSLPLDAKVLAELSVPEGEVDRDGKFRRREDGVILLNFGKNRGRPAKDDPDFLEWMLGKDFSAESKAVARQLLEEVYQEEEARYAASSAGWGDEDDLPF